MSSKIFTVLTVVIVLGAGEFLVYKNFYGSVPNESEKEQGTDQILPEEISIEETASTEEADVSAEEKSVASEPAEEKPITRGIVDSDLIVEVYDKNKAMDGTTLLPDNRNSDKPKIIEEIGRAHV